ncbi:hypothetical protein ACFL59_10930 [Planctomycetota bacterium]
MREELLRDPPLVHLAVIVCALATSGCGYLALGTAAVVSGVRGGDSSSAGNLADHPTEAHIVGLLRRDAQVQEVQIRLRDADGDPTSVRLEYQRQSGAVSGGIAVPVSGAAGSPVGFQPATITLVERLEGGTRTEVPQAEHTVVASLETLTPAGEPCDYVLTWSWKNDLPGGAEADVALRLVTVRPGGGENASLELAGQTVGNEKPVLSAVSIEGRSGRVVVRYRLRDSTSDVCWVQPFFRIEGGAPWPVATSTVVGGSLTDLATATTDRAFDFTWDTVQEPELGLSDRKVRVELIPWDSADATGDRAVSAEIALDNNQVPQVAIAPPVRGLAASDGTIEIELHLSDAESNNTDLDVTFGVVSAATCSDPDPQGITTPATPEGGQAGDGASGLATSTGGRTHTFSWDYGKDLGQGTNRVRVAITPRDAPLNVGSRRLSPCFFVGNDPPPCHQPRHLDPAAHRQHRAGLHSAGRRQRSGVGAGRVRARFGPPLARNPGRRRQPRRPRDLALRPGPYLRLGQQAEPPGG